MTDDPQVEVRPATSRDRRAAVNLLAEVFAGDPLFGHLVPSALPRRHARLRRLFTLEMVRSQRRHATWVAADGSGVILCYPPDGWRATRWENLREDWQWRYVFGRNLGSALEIIESMESYQRQLPRHWFLCYAAVEPSQQRRGVGAALLETVLRECDRTNMPAYLEANEISRRAAARYGFTDRGTIMLPQGGPEVFPMWREPRSSPTHA